MPRILDFSDGFTSNNPAVATTYTASDIANVPSGNLTSTDVQDALNELQNNIDDINESVGQENGIASLDADGKIPFDQIPSVAIVDVYEVADITARDALTVESGDVSLVTDAGSGAKQAYIFDGFEWKILRSEVSLLAHESDTTNIHGIANTSDLVTKTGTETLSNKTFTSPVINVAILEGQGSTPSNPSTGLYKFYVKNSDGKGYFLDENGVETPIGSGSGSGILNFIENSDAEIDTAGWSIYADAPGTYPVDGSGGSPSITWTRSTSSPLHGVGSFLLTKDANDRQGEGVAYDFTLPDLYKSKILQIEVPYVVASGTFEAGSPSTDSNLTVWIYDVTNSRLIQPTTYKLFSNSTSISDKLVANFQSSADSNNYRLLLHIGSTSTNAFTLKFDDIIVSPTTYSFGVTITDWVKYLPIFQGFGTVNPTNVNMYYRYVGSSIEIMGKATWGTRTGVEARFGLPNNHKVSSILTTNTIVGRWFPNTSTSTVYHGLAIAGNDYLTMASTSTTQFTNQNGNALSFDSVATSHFYSVPIEGLSCQVQRSDINDQRISACKVSGDPASASNGNPVIFPTTIYDTHASYNISTGRYTIPTSGIYRVHGYITSSNSGVELSIYKNASLDTKVGTTDSNGECSYTGSIQCNAGDILDIRPNNTLDAATGSTIHIERIANPASISSTETIACRISGDPASASSGNPIIFPTTGYDTHGMFNTTTGRYAVPSAGIYRVYGYITSANAAVKLSIYVDAASVVDVGSTDSNGETTYMGAVRVNAGQLIDLRPNNTLDAMTGSTIHIERIGI